MSEVRFSLLQFGVALTGALLFLFVAAALMRGLHPAFERGLVWLRPGFLRLDRALALTVARWIGLDDERRAQRWGRLLAVLVGSGAIGALLPPFLGAPVLVLGLIAVVAVFRRWAWDEEDRAAGLDPRRAPGREDYNNELLVALSAVFMLGSLLVWRLTGLHLFEAGSGIGILEYVTYVASEALEALPVIGNVEVLGYDNPSGVEAVLPTGGWFAFVLRMALDLLVIGGLLQALAVARRIATGQDLRRHEEALGAAGTEEEADDALRELLTLARRGNIAALALLENIALPSDGGAHYEVFKRRGAADALLNLYESGSVVGVSGLNAAMLTYDVLITPELQREAPLQWARSVAARAHAAYLMGMLAGGEQGRRRLVEAGEGFKLAARSLSILGSPHLADRAELGYWAVEVEALQHVETIAAEQLPLLISGIQGFVDRMGPDADVEVISESHRLIRRVETWMLSRGMTPPIAPAAATPDTPRAQIDRAAATIQQFGRDPSDETLERLDRAIQELEALYAETQITTVRSDAALRLAQAWSARARAITLSRQDALQQIDKWCEALESVVNSAPRVRAVVRGIRADRLVLEASATPFGPAREKLAGRAIETYRRLVNDPDLSNDALSVETRANMAIALLNFAEGARPDLALARLDEAAQLSDSLGTIADPAARASAALTASNVRRDLAPLKPQDQRRDVLDLAIRDAQAAIHGFGELGNEEGRLLAMRALGHSHLDRAMLEGVRPDAERHAREAFFALEFFVARSDQSRSRGLWFKTAHALADTAAYLGRLDCDRDKLETAAALLDELRASCVGGLEAQAPYIDKSRAAVDQTLRDWGRPG